MSSSARGTGREVGTAAGLVEHEGLPGVLRGRREQCRLVAAVRDAKPHLAGGQRAEPGLEGLGVVGQLGHHDLAGGRQLVAVRVLQHGVDEVAERHVELLVDRPRMHAADPPAAHDEQVHGGGELVVVDAEDVEVHLRAEHDRALLEERRRGLQLVAPARRGLVVLHGRGGLHLPREVAEDPLVLVLHEGDEAVDVGAVLLDRDPAGAGAEALADLAGEARPAARHRALVVRVLAGADREELQQQVERLVHRPDLGVRAEVPGAGDAALARDHRAGRLVAEGDHEVRVGLVVLEAHVERRMELVDPGDLELQRLDVALHDGPLHGCRGGHHPARALVQRAERCEVVREPCPEVLGLAHVQHAPVGVEESVHARVGGDLPRLRAIWNGAAHPRQLATSARSDAASKISRRK